MILTLQKLDNAFICQPSLPRRKPEWVQSIGTPKSSLMSAYPSVSFTILFRACDRFLGRQ